MYATIDHKVIQREFNERLQIAARERRARRLQANRPGLTAHVRHGLGKVLVAVGQKLQAQDQPVVLPRA